jgi:hypothetical protein
MVLVADPTRTGNPDRLVVIRTRTSPGGSRGYRRMIVGALVNSSSASAAPPSSDQQLADKYVPYVVVRVQAEECGQGEPSAG